MLYSSHQIHINQLSCVNFNVGSNFKIHVPHTHNFGCWVKICVNGGMRVNFKTSPLSLWPDTKSILITILNKHDASLPCPDIVSLLATGVQLDQKSHN